MELTATLWLQCSRNWDYRHGPQGLFFNMPYAGWGREFRHQSACPTSMRTWVQYLEFTFKDNRGLGMKKSQDIIMHLQFQSKEDSWGLLAGQPSLRGGFQVSEKYCLKKKSTQGCPLVYMLYAQLCVYVHECTYTHRKRKIGEMLSK